LEQAAAIGVAYFAAWPGLALLALSVSPADIEPISVDEQLKALIST
jgi:hypothetical protein